LKVAIRMLSAPVSALLEAIEVGSNVS
jgi:hypothetical protein